MDIWLADPYHTFDPGFQRARRRIFLGSIQFPEGTLSHKTASRAFTKLEVTKLEEKIWQIVYKNRNVKEKD